MKQLLKEGVRYPDIPDGIGKILLQVRSAVKEVDRLNALIEESEKASGTKAIALRKELYYAEARLYPFKSTYTYRTHYGNLAWWHSMWSPNAKSVFDLRDKIFHRLQYLAAKAVKTTNCVKAGHFLGQALHTIQHSWSKSHVERGSFNYVVRFQDYRSQNPTSHGAADKRKGSTEYYNAMDDSVAYLNRVLCYDPKYGPMDQLIRNTTLRLQFDSSIPTGPIPGGASKGYERNP